MSEAITKKDLEQVLDKKLGEYQSSTIEAVDSKFQRVEHRMDIFEIRLQRVEAGVSELRQEIRQLTTTTEIIL